MKIIVRLKKVFEQSGLGTAYRLGKKAGVSTNTADRYISSDEVELGYIDPALIKVCRALGVDWRDSRYIEVIEDESEAAGQLLLA